MFWNRTKKAETKIKASLKSIDKYFSHGFFDAGMDTAMKTLEVAIDKLNPKNPLYGIAHHKVAQGFCMMGMYVESLNHFLKANETLLKLPQKGGPKRLELLAEIAEVYLKVEDFYEAIDTYEYIAELQKERYGPTHPIYGSCLYDLGEANRLYQYYKKATTYFTQAYEIFIQADPSEYSMHVADAQIRLGFCYLVERDYVKAEEYFVKGISAFPQELSVKHQLKSDVLLNLSNIYTYLDQPNKALTALQEVEKINEYILQSLFFKAGTEAKMEYIQQLKKTTHQYLSLVVQYFQDTPEVVESCYDLILRRKSVGLDIMLHFRQFFDHAKDKLTKETWFSFNKAKKKFAKIQLEGPKPDQSQDEHIEAMMDKQIEIQKLEAVLGKRYHSSPLMEVMRATTFAEIKGHIPEGAAIAEFAKYDWFEYTSKEDTVRGFQGKTKYLVFVVQSHPQSQLRLIDLGDAHIIDDSISEIRGQITGKEQNRSATVAAEEAESTRALKRKRKSSNTISTDLLLERVFLPLKITSKNVVILPDGLLAQIPFEIFTDGKGGELIDHHQFSYLRTGRDFCPQKIIQTTQSPPIIIADPEYDYPGEKKELASLDSILKETFRGKMKTQGIQFLPLPGTRTEGEKIAQIFGVTPILGRDATESKVRESHSPIVLHLATHGFYLDNQQKDDEINSLGKLGNAALSNVLRSGLVFTGVNAWINNTSNHVNDGILNAEEVAALDLSGTELVVLSACETGLGEVQDGEGVIGISRAFTLAGAKVNVVALWEVPDLITQQLMVEFYTRLYSGLPPQTALREAKLEIRKTNPKISSWGGFICQGYGKKFRKSDYDLPDLGS